MRFCLVVVGLHLSIEQKLYLFWLANLEARRGFPILLRIDT